jgi:hypothetical protein
MDFRAHYTDFGILPSAALAGYGWISVWTLHALASPSPAAVGLLFALAAAAAVALLLGWHSWSATFVSWLLLSSIQYRQPALCFGGDVMLRMLLFWGLFLPLGARFSLDARRHAERTPAGNRSVSVAGAALLLQVCGVYWFSVLNRTGPTWWNGTALHYALHYDYFASRFGLLLREHEAWLPSMTYAAIWFEGLGPFLAFVPVATGCFRTLAVVLFIGFHATLGLLFNLGLFPAVFCVAWLAFLPEWFWRRLPVRAETAAAGGRPWDRWSDLRNALAAVALAFVIASNLSTVRGDAVVLNHSPPSAWDLPARLIRIDQRWGLFAPDPPIHDGWYAMKGVRADGQEVDLLDPTKPFSFGKPPVVSETMNIRWREYLFRLELEARDPRWVPYGRWLCRSFDESRAGGTRLARAYVYYVQERTTAGAPVPEGILTLLAHACEGSATSGAPPAGGSDAPVSKDGTAGRRTS